MKTTLETNALKYAGKAQRFTLQSFKKELCLNNEEEEKELLQKLFQEKQLVCEPMYVYRYIKEAEEFPDLKNVPCITSILRYAKAVELFTFSSLYVEIGKDEEILQQSVRRLIDSGYLERRALLAYHFIGSEEEIKELEDSHACLEKRRQEILARLQAASHDEDEYDDGDLDDFSSLFEFDKDDEDSEDSKWNELCLLALKKSIEEQKISCSFLQKKLCVGYNKAQKLLEWMIRENYITRKGKYVYRLEIQKKDFDVLCYKMQFPNLAFEELTEEEQASYDLSDIHSTAQRKIEVCRVLRVGYTISTGHHKIIENLEMCYPNDTPYCIEIKEDNDICFFSDGGLTMAYLKENIAIQEPLNAKRIEHVIHQFNIEVVEEELHFKISSPQAAISVLTYFMIAIDKLVDLATIDCIHQACEQLDAKCYSVIMEYFCSNGDLSREEIISKTKEDLSNVAEDEPEKIVILEHILRGFACVSDEYYATIKKEFMRHKSDE